MHESEELIKKGSLNNEWGRYFSKQQTYRERADYETDVDLTREDLQEHLSRAEKFIDRMEEFL